MINISQEFKDLYKQESIPKKISLYFPELDLTIENDKIVNGSLTIEESLCSEIDLTLGSCESSQFQITVADIIQDLNYKRFTVTQTVNEIYTMQLGTYIVDSTEKQSDKRFKKITAYDFMKQTDVDVSSWYNGLTWPQTVKSIRESLLAYLGLEYEIQTLTNDTVQLSKTVNTSSLIGRDILRRLTEINAGFGHFTRDGKFKVIQLSGLGLYPSETLYPAEDLFPSESGEYITAGYEYADYEEYTVEPITSVIVREDDEDTGATAGTPGNNYIITGNYLLYGKSATELQTIVDNILLQVRNKYYRPHNTTMIGLPYMEVGDSVTIITSNDAIESFIFKRTLTGIQALKDNISASGNQVRDQKVSPMTEIQQTKSKVLKIQKSVDQLSIDMTDMEEGLQSQITLTAGQLQTQITDNKNDAESQFTQQSNAIGLKVSKGDVSSQLSIEPGQVTINSNRLIVDSTNFKLDSAGNATFSGNITGGTMNIANNFTVDNLGNVYAKTQKFGGISYDVTVNDDGLSIKSKSTNLEVAFVKWNGVYGEYLQGNSLYLPSISAFSIGGSDIRTKLSEVGHHHNSIYNNSDIAQVTSFGSNFRPHSDSGDNAVSCGSPSYRWTQVYAATATISTSDRGLKDDIQELSEKEKNVASKIKLLFRTFKFKDAMLQKGYSARIHTGVIAQDVKCAFESEGLNPYDYALFCSDTWYEVDGKACNDEEEPYTTDSVGAIEVTQLGLRYEELLCFVIGAM